MAFVVDVAFAAVHTQALLSSPSLAICTSMDPVQGGVRCL